MGLRPAAIGLTIAFGTMLSGGAAYAQATTTVSPPVPAAAANQATVLTRTAEPSDNGVVAPSAAAVPTTPLMNGFERVHSQPAAPSNPPPALSATPAAAATEPTPTQAAPPQQTAASPATPEPAVTVAAPTAPAVVPEQEPSPALAAPPLPAFVAAPNPAPSGNPAVAEAIQVTQPKLVNTGKIDANGKLLDLYGVIGQEGDATQMLQDNIAKTGGTLACAEHGTTPTFDCKMANGTDLSLFALVNGVAQVSPDAPAIYQAQENAARDARRGIWSSLPPPPVSLKHPGVYDTATLIAAEKRYPLDGIEGAGGDLASTMAGYLQSKGDEVLCQPQGKAGAFVCLLTDGTDIATVALVNGAARTAQDAPDNYRLQEADAVKNHRGIWQTVPDTVIQATLQWDATPAAYAVEYGYGPDPAELADTSDGVVWVGGQPTAVIGAETVFLVYAGAVGWGYYDHDRHWHGAPDRFAHHMERFHPEGRGIRGFPERAAFHPGGLEHGAPGLVRPGFERPGLERPGMGRPLVERPAFEHPAFARPGMPGGPMAHPGGGPAFARPGMEPHPGMPANFARPGMPGMAAPGMRPGMAQPAMVRPGMPQPAGRPAVLAGRPAAMPMARPMPAAAPRPAPAPRAAPARSCAKKC